MKNLFNASFELRQTMFKNWFSADIKPKHIVVTVVLISCSLLHLLVLLKQLACSWCMFLFLPAVYYIVNTQEIQLPSRHLLAQSYNRNTKATCEICSKLTINTPERRYWRRSGVFIVNFEHISNIVLVFLLLTLRR